jgi:hypothetical protein
MLRFLFVPPWHDDGASDNLKPGRTSVRGASSGPQVAHGAQGHFGAAAWPQGPGPGIRHCPLLPNAPPANLPPRLMPLPVGLWEAQARTPTPPPLAALCSPLPPGASASVVLGVDGPYSKSRLMFQLPARSGWQCRANPKTAMRQTPKPTWVGTIRPECAHLDKKVTNSLRKIYSCVML